MFGTSTFGSFQAPQQQQQQPQTQVFQQQPQQPQQQQQVPFRPDTKFNDLPQNVQNYLINLDKKIQQTRLSLHSINPEPVELKIPAMPISDLPDVQALKKSINELLEIFDSTKHCGQYSPNDAVSKYVYTLPSLNEVSETLDMIIQMDTDGAYSDDDVRDAIAVLTRIVECIERKLTEGWELEAVYEKWKKTMGKSGRTSVYSKFDGRGSMIEVASRLVNRSVYGNAPANVNTTATGSLFNPAGSTTGGSLFGQPSTTTGGGLFGSNTGTIGGGGLFGQANTSTSTGGGLFGQSNTTSTGATGGGLFGSNTTNTSTTAGGLFGQTNTTNTTGGLFGQSNNTNNGGMFGSNTGNATTNTSGGLFGQPSTTTAGTSIFGQNTSNTGTTGTGGLFGQSTAPSGGLFGQSTNTGSGLFGQSQPATTGTGLFGQSNMFGSK